MEANRKRSRGFLKGKLAPFYKAPKPSPTTVQYTTTTTTKVKPNHSSPSPASVGIVVHQDYTISQPNPNPKVVLQRGNLVSRLEEFYGLPEDESVDTKAGLYISMVQQRLTVEREPKKFQEE